MVETQKPPTSPIPPESMCSKGIPIDFFWRDCCDGEHIKAAVDTLVDLVFSGPNRLRDAWRESEVRGQFTARLENAAAGKLKPIDHVKPIGRGQRSHLNLFEIRWPGVRVKERAGSTPRFVDIEVRLYYIDLEDRCAVVGLHAHEKGTEGSQDDIADAQDAAIDEAIKIFQDGHPSRWGIPELLESS